MEKCKIQLAKEEDAIYCINLSKNYWPRWWSGNEKFGINHIKSCIKEKRCFVAVINDKIIGFILWGILWNKAHLQDIFVKNEYRKDGIGKLLIDKMAEVTKKQGFREIMSDTDVSNKTAIAFHRKNGFKKCGYIKNNWDQESSYVFSKKL